MSGPPPQTHWPALHFELLSLKVYSLVPWGQVPTSFSNFWWKDDRYPQGFGPFSCLRDCMKDFEVSMRIRSPDVKPKEGNVIEVDFIGKKRL